MHVIVISKKSHKLNHVTCDCGYTKFTTTGGGADLLGRIHARSHDEHEIVFKIDDVVVNSSGRRAMHRNAGGIGLLGFDNDGNAYQV